MLAKIAINTVATDVATQSLAVNEASSMSNFSFRDGALIAAKGPLATYSGLPGDPIDYLSLSNRPHKDILALTENRADLIRGLASSNVTGTANLNASLDANWSMLQVGMFAVISSRMTAPLYLDNAPGSTLAPLPAWDATETCGVLSQYKDFLVAGDIVGNNGSQPDTVKWSSSADANSLPLTWDIADPAHDAGLVQLDTSSGSIVAMKQLGDANIIYKDWSTHLMRYTGGAYVFAFSDISLSVGAVNQKSVVEHQGAHVVLSYDDVVLVNTTQVRSIVESRVRRAFFNQIDFPRIKRSFAVKSSIRSEIWFCVVKKDSVSNVPDLALVWNYKHGTFSFRNIAPTAAANEILIPVEDLPVNSTPNESIFISQSKFWASQTDNWSSSTQTWDGLSVSTQSSNNGASLDTNLGWNIASTTWDTSVVPWNGTVVGTGFKLSFTGAVGSSISLLDEGPNSELKYIEKLSFTLSEDLSLPLIRKIVPRVTGSGELSIAIGTQYSLDDSILWSPTQTYILNQDDRINLFAKGRYISLFVSTSSSDLQLQSLDIDFAITSKI